MLRIKNSNTLLYGDNVPNPYLSFIGNEDFTLKTGNTTKNWDGTLEYSTDKTTWNTWDGTEISSSGNKLYLRGAGNTNIGSSFTDYKFVFTGTNSLKIACRGNIENLLDYNTVSAGNHPAMADYCYENMFRDCTSLTTAPELPATTLADYCYTNMFYGCTSLKIAPQLPATTLANYCYQGMFQGCTSLIVPPSVLPATTLTTQCYHSMFSDCSSLTSPPELPAITLATQCYQNMFYKCSSLTTAPNLPATTLAKYCYSYMFYHCTSLTIAPALPAITLYNYCYENMFVSCSSLTTAPELPATTLAEGCYQGMFAFCTFKTPSELPATTLANRCYRTMFQGCTSLTSVSALPATKLAVRCYDSMFSGCTNIKLSSSQTGEYQTEYRIPTTGTGTTSDYALDSMFANTGGTFTGTPEINTTYYTSNMVVSSPYLSFIGNEDFTLKTGNTTKNWDGTLEYSTDKTTWNIWDGTEISSSGSNLYLRGTGNTKITGNSPDYRFVFTGTNTLKIACNGNIENLLDYNTVTTGGHPTMATYCYCYIFDGCTALTTAPELPATTLAQSCYRYMFRGCTRITTAPALPATTLAYECYYCMFRGCTSLTTAPSVLPATTLAIGCYKYMFEFTAINAVPKIMATTYATDSCKGMFDDIKTLNVYSTSGTGHTYGWTAPSSASSYCSGMFGSDDGESEWAKLDGSNFPNSGTPTDGTIYYFNTVV